MEPIASVLLGTSILTWVTNAHLLGLAVDKKLSWVPQVQENEKELC